MISIMWRKLASSFKRENKSVFSGSLRWETVMLLVSSPRLFKALRPKCHL